MACIEQLTLFHKKTKDLTVRQMHIIRSPKKNGTAYDDSKFYLNELDVEIINNPQFIQFYCNSHDLVHRWSPYVQGFSAQFVQRTLEKFSKEHFFPIIFDPFAGSGTVLVQSKLNNFAAYGVELNPLLYFIAKTKLETWQTNPDRLLKVANNLPKKHIFEAPLFLKSEKQFRPEVLQNLEILKSGIDAFKPYSEEDIHIKNLMTIAFSAIIIDCSNLKRTPCLGYSHKKFVNGDSPFTLFSKKVKEITEDLSILQNGYKNITAQGNVFLANSKDFKDQNNYDLVITSPPYMNGLDYVMNYKIEMGWLGFAENHKELKQLKDQMVVCDNVSKGAIKNFSCNKQRYTNDWLEDIKNCIDENIIKRGNYRRSDMSEIVHKYFDDMYQVMKCVVCSIFKGGRFILVVGDSLIADVYIPTDLILARIGKELGLSIEKIEKARNRRSGQIRSYQLRESIITLKKD